MSKEWERQIEADRRRRLRGPYFSYRKQLTERTVNEMLANGYAPNDKAAIRFISNNIMDQMERAGIVTMKESDRLSQDVTIQEVQRMMNQAKSRFNPKTLNKEFGPDWKTYKTVSYKDIIPLSHKMAEYQGRIYGTKENLNFKPSNVRLVQIGR